MCNVSVDDHPLLDVALFGATFPKPLGEIESPASLLKLLELEANHSLPPVENAKQLVRDLLRHGGYKPTGRGKPASEYLVKAVGEKKLGSINLVVDACNVVSLHSQLPISVVDLDKAREPLRIGIAPPESSYVFNPSGQEIKIDGLLGLFDADGPCANGVKDSQRTKTSPATTRTLSIVWGTNQLPTRANQAAIWYRELLEAAGATCFDISST